MRKQNFGDFCLMIWFDGKSFAAVCGASEHNDLLLRLRRQCWLFYLAF